MGRRRWVLAVIFVAGLSVAAACSNDGGTDGSEAAGSRPATTYRVVMDNDRPADVPATYDEYFPSRLTVRAGDTIDFAMPAYSGEPHNVALGTVVTGASEALDSLPPGTQIFPGMPVPGLAADLVTKLAKLPQALPPNVESTAVAFAKLAPCRLESGDPPLDASCPPDQRNVGQPFGGSESYVASPVLFRDDSHFKVRLSKTIRPDSYSFVCTLHPAVMRGAFTVAPRARTADTPAEVRRRGRTEVAALNTKYTPVAKRLAAQPGPQVDAGYNGADHSPYLSVNVFPSRISIRAGDTVTWRIKGAHQITFNPPEAMQLYRTLEQGPDGIVRPTKDDLEKPGPGQPGMPPLSLATPAVIDGGRFDGRSYLHTGLLYGSLAVLPPTSYKLTFTDPGKHVYYCMRHPGMVGTVSVR